MFNFILSQILFYLAIILVLFIPGYFLLSAIIPSNKLSTWEKIPTWLSMSFISSSFLIILIGSTSISINTWTIITSILLFSGICFFISRKRFGKQKDDENANFSKNQKILIFLLIALTILIKTIYLTDTIFPTSTDFGHHMYWSKLISQTGELPNYQEREIITDTTTYYHIGEPEKIADFIIGEHLIFSAINLISGISFISYFPALILFLVNIMGILALFAFAYRIFENTPLGKNIAIFTLLFIGPIYALASPQAKYISGGVIGNMFGNLLIPLVLLFLYRALKEKKRWFMFTSILLATGMFYTHHLSSFVFIYIFLFTLIIFTLTNFKKILTHIKEWIHLIFNKPIIILLASIILFSIFIYTPNYIETSAVETAVGGPSKSTRAGLSLVDLKFSSGQARSAMAVIGIVLLPFALKYKKYSFAFTLGWLISIFAMSTKPEWMYLDIPSGRIANYIVYPLSIFASLGLVVFFDKIKKSIPKNISIFTFILLILYIFTNGFQDNSFSLSTGSDPEKASQTFHASQYISKYTNENDVIVKDHNYLTSDTWIKLFFMRDYNFPFSRSYFKRYNDPVKDREQCTLNVISAPNSAEGKKCFEDLGVNFLIINPQIDGPQFNKSKKFWKVYESNSIGIYYRNNE